MRVCLSNQQTVKKEFSPIAFMIQSNIDSYIFKNNVRFVSHTLTYSENVHENALPQVLIYRRVIFLMVLLAGCVKALLEQFIRLETVNKQCFLLILLRHTPNRRTYI